MLLIEFIENYYGDKRGNKASFLRDNSAILPQELNRWIKADLKVNMETGEIYKPTSKKIDMEKTSASKESGLSAKTRIKLNTCAERIKMGTDELINALLDDEMERNELMKEARAENEINPPVQVLAEIINRHFSELFPVSETYEYQAVFRALRNELLEKGLISLWVPENCIAESQRLPIPRVAYYWYAGIIAKRIAMMMGSRMVYLWHELYATNNEVVFLGAPNNAVACYLICERTCKLLKQTKSAYKKSLGRGSRKDLEDTANNYMSQFAQSIIEPEIFIYNEDSQSHLLNYAVEKYPYAMD